MDYFAKNFTTARNVARSQVFLEPGEWYAKVLCSRDVFVSAEMIEAGDKIYVAKLRKGSKVLYSVITNNLPEGVTGTIGYEGKPNALGAFSGFGTEATRFLIPLSDKPLVGEIKVFITIESGSFGKGKTIRTQIFYTQN